MLMALPHVLWLAHTNRYTRQQRSALLFHYHKRNNLQQTRQSSNTILLPVKRPMTKDMVSIHNAVWNIIALIQITLEEYIVSVESIRTEHNVWLKFCTQLLRFIDIPYILIPTWSHTCSFLLKIANINTYVHHNIKLQIKTHAHYLWDWLTCFIRDSITHYIYYVTEF